MSKVTKVRRSQAEFERLIAEREREGLTWQEIAQRGGVPISTLQGWAARLRKMRRRTGFVEVTRAPAQSPRMEVVLANGRRVRWQCVGGLPENLGELIALLESC